jgi:hypothetical protein
MKDIFAVCGTYCGLLIRIINRSSHYFGLLASR